MALLCHGVHGGDRGSHHGPFGENSYGEGGARAIRAERSLAQIRTRAAAVRAAVVPDWLAELVRPKPAPLPWPDMIRAALAICVPLGVAFALHKTTIGLLPAAGGLVGALTHRGGSVLNQGKRVRAGGAGAAAVG